MYWKAGRQRILATNAIMIVETMPPCIGLGQSKRPKSCTYTPSLSGLASADWFLQCKPRTCLQSCCEPRNCKGNVSKCDALVNIVSLCKFKGRISSIWVPICPNHQPLDRSAIFCSQPPGSSWFQKATDLQLDSSQVQPFRVFSSHLYRFTPTSCNEWITDHGWAMLSLRMHKAYERMTWHEWHSHIVTWHWWSPGIFSLDISGAIPIPSWQRQAMVVLLAVERLTQRALLAGQRGSKISYPANLRKLTHVRTTLTINNI